MTFKAASIVKNLLNLTTVRDENDRERILASNREWERWNGYCLYDLESKQEEVQKEKTKYLFSPRHGPYHVAVKWSF